MNEDEARGLRLQRMIAETEEAIAKAREVNARIDAMFQGMGFEDSDEYQKWVRSGTLSPDLQRMLDEDAAQLQRELDEGEAALLAESGRGLSAKPRRRPRRMTRI